MNTAPLIQIQNSTCERLADGSAVARAAPRGREISTPTDTPGVTPPAGTALTWGDAIHAQSSPTFHDGTTSVTSGTASAETIAVERTRWRRAADRRASNDVATRPTARIRVTRIIAPAPSGLSRRWPRCD